MMGLIGGGGAFSPDGSSTRSVALIHVGEEVSILAAVLSLMWLALSKTDPRYLHGVATVLSMWGPIASLFLENPSYLMPDSDNL